MERYAPSVSSGKQAVREEGGSNSGLVCEPACTDPYSTLPLGVQLKESDWHNPAPVLAAGLCNL